MVESAVLLPELNSPQTTPILHMSQLQLLILFTLGMEIDTTDLPIDLIEAYVIEAFKARSTNRLDPVIRHEKVLLPPHKHVFLIRRIAHREGRILPGIFGKRPPAWKPVPVLKVDFLRGAPGGVGCAEEVFGADDFAFEKCGESGVIVGQACEVKSILAFRGHHT